MGRHRLKAKERKRVRRLHGHPEAVAAKKKKAQAWRQPDADEKVVQELNRKHRRAILENPEQGVVVGPLTAAAEHLAAQVSDDLTERALVTLYLVGTWGQVAKEFPGTPDLKSFDEWVGSHALSS
jgi:hypothetical protein